MTNLDTRPEAIASYIDFLEGELLEMGLDASMAEKALIRHPTCERYKARLAEIYAITSDIASTLGRLRAQATRAPAAAHLH